MAEYKSKRNDLLKAVAENDKYDQKLIKKALDFATEYHDGQFRHSGEPYIEHPINVALILVGLGMDNQSIVAALLHDIIEDTEVTYETVEQLFGSEVAKLVDGVTKLGKIPYYSREEQQAENLRKMFLAMSEDVRVIIIKLADRLHNMRTIESHNPQKRLDISKETLEVYAPIAHRLGIRGIKEELEDLCIRQLDPVAYAEILGNLDERKTERTEFINNIIEKIKERLTELDFKNFNIDGRVKSIHGIYRKMYLQGKAFDEIYDIYAVRIIVDTVNDCYNVLGMIHDMFRPIPGRFKDYISTPKPNNYQSLHTTLIDREGIPFEIQIRTWEMHRTAEYGIAAHWKYKAGVNESSKMDAQLTWIRQILEAQQDSGEAEDFVQSIKTDLTSDDVFVVTPKGDVISLPVGSTVIDFAYAIHSAVGNRMIGAKVDGRIVPIDYKVKNGEIIDIITTNQQDHGPARDWLNIVKTSEARSKIRSWFKKERRPENIAEGKAILEREFRRDFVFTEEKKEQFIQHFSEVYHCNSVDDFYAAIGYGGILISRLIPRMKDEYNRNYKPTPEMQKPVLSTVSPKLVKSTEGVVVEGVDNCLIKLARCCEPLPGDSIIGFITRGHGVSIHKRDCPNVPKDISSCEQPDRWIKARWANRQGDGFKATVVILAVDRQSLLADVTNTLVNMRVPLHNVNARELKDGNCEILITISTEGTEHLKNIIAKLGKISNVFSVERTGN